LQLAEHNDVYEATVRKSNSGSKPLPDIVLSIELVVLCCDLSAVVIILAHHQLPITGLAATAISLLVIAVVVTTSPPFTGVHRVVGALWVVLDHT